LKAATRRAPLVVVKKIMAKKITVKKIMVKKAVVKKWPDSGS
jgi:hypothetical protein